MFWHLEIWRSQKASQHSNIHIKWNKSKLQIALCQFKSFCYRTRSVNERLPLNQIYKTMQKFFCLVFGLVLVDMKLWTSDCFSLQHCSSNTVSSFIKSPAISCSACSKRRELKFSATPLLMAWNSLAQRLELTVLDLWLRCLKTTAIISQNRGFTYQHIYSSY